MRRDPVAIWVGPKSEVKVPTSRKQRETWGTLVPLCHCAIFDAYYGTWLRAREGTGAGDDGGGSIVGSCTGDDLYRVGDSGGALHGDRAIARGNNVGDDLS